MLTLNVVTINGSINEVSKTGVLLDLVLDTLREKLAPSGSEIAQTAIEMRTLRRDFALADTEDDLSDAAQQAIAALSAADLVIAGTPIYKSSYSGVFKLFFDFVDAYAIANKPVMMTATGGTEKHQMAIDTMMRPLFAHFQAHVAPVGIYASSNDFAGYEILNPEVFARVEMAIDDILPWFGVEKG